MLTDEVASKVLGELHVLTKHIDEQSKLVSQTAITIRNAAEQIKASSDEAIKNAKESSRQVAGDTAAAEKGKAIYWAGVALFVSALIFGGTGYMIRMSADKLSMSAAQEEVDRANSRADEAIAIAEKKASDEIDAARKNSGWVGTENGRLAKRFFDSGSGAIAAKCNSPVWEVVESTDGKYCVPKRRQMFGDDGQQYGWKIP